MRSEALGLFRLFFEGERVKAVWLSGVVQYKTHQWVQYYKDDLKFAMSQSRIRQMILPSKNFSLRSFLDAIGKLKVERVGKRQKNFPTSSILQPHFH